MDAVDVAKKAQLVAAKAPTAALLDVGAAWQGLSAGVQERLGTAIIV